MFWHSKRGTSRPQRKALQLRVEALEPRQMLSGTVQVQLNTVNSVTSLTLSATVSNAYVQLESAENASGQDIFGEYVITGLPDAGGNQTYIGTSGQTSQTVYGVNGNINVALGQGYNQFDFEGMGTAAPPASQGTWIAANSRSTLPGSLNIINGGGTNTNIINNVNVNGDFTVTQATGMVADSTLDMYNSTVIGDTVVNNANGLGYGASTTFTNCTLDGNTQNLTLTKYLALQVNNGAGTSTVTVNGNANGNSVLGSSTPTAADTIVSISNNSGNQGSSFTVFTNGTATVGPTVYGGVQITNAAAPTGCTNFLSLNQATVYGAVAVNNGAGTASTTVSSSGLGTVYSSYSPLTVTNGAGLDSASITDSIIPSGVFLTNDAGGASGTGVFGSTTTVTGSTIGANPAGLINSKGVVEPAFYLSGDQGSNTVNFLTDSTGGITQFGVGTVVQIALGGGGNTVDLDSATMSSLQLTTGAGSNSVTLKGVQISYSVDIDMTGGANTLTLVKSTWKNSSGQTYYSSLPSPLTGNVLIDGGTALGNTLNYDIQLPTNGVSGFDNSNYNPNS